MKMDLLALGITMIISCDVTAIRAAGTPRVQVLANQLSSIFEAKTSYSVIRKRIKDARLEYTAEPAHCQEVKSTLHSTRVQIEALFRHRVKALKRIVDEAERLSAGAQLKLQDTEYCYSGVSVPYSCMESESVRLDTDYADYNREMLFRYNALFRRTVSFVQSGVQIPDYVPQKGIRLNRHLDVTQPLDRIFRENRKESPGISWQYLGTESGMFRIFPAFSWTSDEEDYSACSTKRFDARHRPWYGRALLPPQDLLILLDVSGSVYGQPLRLIKSLAQALVDSLNDDDYVGIVEFNRNVTFIPCTTGFTLATMPAKSALKEAINMVTHGKVGTYEAALKFAFDAFAEHDRFINISRRQFGLDAAKDARVKVIVMLSDGSTEFPKEVLDQRDPNATVRIISFQVGLDINPKGGLMKMACSHNGLFLTVSLKETIPQKILRSKYPLYAALNWTRSYPYYISNVYEDCLGTGAVVSLFMAVHDYDTISKENFMGVAGVDIQMEEISELLANKSKVLRTILINKSGYVLYHSHLDRVNRSMWNNFSVVVDWTTLEPRLPELEKIKRQVYRWQSGHIHTVFWERSNDPRRLRPVPVTYVFELVVDDKLMLIHVHAKKYGQPCATKPMGRAEKCETYCAKLNVLIQKSVTEYKRPWLVCCGTVYWLQRLHNFTVEDVHYTALYRPDEIQFQPIPTQMYNEIVGYDMLMYRLLLQHPYPAVIGTFTDKGTILSAMELDHERRPTLIMDDSGTIYADYRNGSNATESFSHVSDSHDYLWDHFVEKGVLESEMFAVPAFNCSITSGVSRSVPFLNVRLHSDVVYVFEYLRLFWTIFGQFSALIGLMILWILPMTVFALKADEYRKLTSNLCTKKEMLSYWRKGAVASYGSVKCSSSIREFGLNKISGTNLLMLTAAQYDNPDDNFRKDPIRIATTADKCPNQDSIKHTWKPMASEYFPPSVFDYMSTEDCAYAKVVIASSTAALYTGSYPLAVVIFSVVIAAVAFIVIV
ncbi:voltage-dependent calcium channel subunit alpha-2/delta-2-like isoform X2 [Paramacrobiotus metropolitanus]|uniref:voltage-dependent calcium channel subunit alpha-2/delta-2-like isoform X2 n=1 Tax=Paramacrobiotus metropolitanus TaxID=2943436 RepID=UPI00244583EA|nr:voltage-dependent calcium channel subunit alpha-2/delta-2-like isoform X2 [Paramacrobiotus metropolitanus]